MEIKEGWMKNLPQQFKNKRNIEVLINAFADELQEVEEMFEQLKTMRNLNNAIGAQLDGIGDIVVLNRANAALYAGVIDFDVIDDERYRLFLKYKAIRNSNQCTFQELAEACKLLYDAQIIYYREDPAYPATFFLSIGAKIDPNLIALLKNSNMTVKPAGVKVNVNYFDMEFFGFADMNRFSLGFGQGRFAQTV